MKYVKVIISIVAVVIVYMLGCMFPLNFFKLEVKREEITQVELIKIFISVISALITSSAVIVALFKEKILGRFNRPLLTIEKPNIKPTYEHISDQKTFKKGEIIKSSKYTSRLKIRNLGNVAATNVELFLEKIDYKSINSEIEENFEPPGDSIVWGNSKENINILPNSEKLINIVEIFAPQNTSTPESSTMSTNAELIIGNFVDCTKKNTGGVYTAHFVLHAQNHKHLAFKVRIEWKGKWKDRLTDFETEYDYKILN